MLEFAFIRERKAASLLDNAAGDVMNFASQLSSLERSATLAWSNAALLAGIAKYGRAFAYAPMRMKRERAVDAVLDFAAYRMQVETVLRDISDRPAHDPATSAFKWEMLGSSVAMLTAGASFHSGARQAAREAWKLLGTARPYAREAVRVMSIYGKTYGVEVVPRIPGKTDDKPFLLALASTLPPMFRSK